MLGLYEGMPTEASVAVRPRSRSLTCVQRPTGDTDDRSALLVYTARVRFVLASCSCTSRCVATIVDECVRGGT